EPSARARGRRKPRGRRSPPSDGAAPPPSSWWWTTSLSSASSRSGPDPYSVYPKSRSRSVLILGVDGQWTLSW
ncbi:unnamed protein product, partial [Musa acuminata subsp. burmannicoides]